MPTPRTLLLLLAAVFVFAHQPIASGQTNAAPAPAPAAPVPPQMQQAVAPPEPTRPPDSNDRADVYKGLITTLREGGDNAAALAQLEGLPPGISARLSLDPDFLFTSAAIYAAVGNNDYALRLLKAAESAYTLKGQAVPLGLQIQECYLLLNMGDDAALHSRLLYVTQIAERADALTDEQRTTLDNLWIYLALRRSSQEAKAGNQRKALRILITASETYPDNALVKRALAGAFLNAGDAKTALQLYKEAGVNDSTPAEYQGAIGAAFAAGDREDAGKWLHALLEKSPNDPQALTLAAKVEQAAGHRKLAAQYYRLALQNMPKPKRTLSIPATLRDEPAPGSHAPASPLTTLASVTDPSGATTAYAGDTATTIGSVSTSETRNYSSARLPGERDTPVLVPIYIGQTSPQLSPAAPSLPVRATTQSLQPSDTRPAAKAHPELHHRGTSSTIAATSLNSYAAQGGAGDGASSLYRFKSQVNQRLGDYDPSR